MLNPPRATHAIAVAPHHLASQSALAVMREGGNALEAMIAAAATIAVVYPHMNGIGGDSFWVVLPPGDSPAFSIDACGGAAQNASIATYASRGLSAIPIRGALAANTVAGTMGGWQKAFEISREYGGKLPLSRLLSDAIEYAENGIAVTQSQENATRAKFAELKDVSGFSETFLIDGKLPQAGQRFRHPRMARTLKILVRDGLQSFYSGELAQEIAADLARIGSLLNGSDLRAYKAEKKIPLQLAHSSGTLYNMTPPTQGAVSLAILGILDRLGLGRVAPDSADHIHLVVEATKRAFQLRDQHITDPAEMHVAPQVFFDDENLDALAATIDMNRALPWGKGRGPGDTIWMGAIDSHGLAVSFIQSIYHEFGSGVVLPTTGINWQNRGASFSLDAYKLLALKPGKKPFHTLNPAAARLKDGRTMVYGTMGGDGQPQTQAAVFTRAIWFGQPLSQAIAAPRWLLGRTWGQSTDSLKLESRFPPEIIADLSARGHDIEILNAYDETMGHAGALIRHPDGTLEGGTDPRSDGGVAGY